MFLPLTMVTVDGRTVLAVECACGVRLSRGILVEFDGTWMLCHSDCLERIAQSD